MTSAGRRHRQRLAEVFRHLHDRDAARPLVLPNAWDALSARVIEVAGAPAIATTSAGVSWALGRPDGQGLSRDAMLAVVERIAAVVDVPVTADIEDGYGTGSPSDVAETVRGVLEAGAVGVNLEDSPGTSGAPLVDVDAQGERIAAARSASAGAGIDLFINARIDTYLCGGGANTERLDETVRRARAYLSAGADGVFVPGVVDHSTIGRLAAEISAPLNVMVGPGSLPVVELRALGVARVSLGPSLTRSAMAHIRRAAAEILRDGTYGVLLQDAAFTDADALFDARASRTA